MKSQTYNRLKISSCSYDTVQLNRLACDKIAQLDRKTWEYEFYHFLTEWISDRPTIVAKTSGSTGHPKKIEMEKYRMIQSALKTGEFLGLKQNQKALLCLPVDNIAGKMMIVRAFVLGLNLFPVKPTGNPIDNINQNFNFAAMTPHQVYNTFMEKDGVHKLNRIKNLIIGGGDISQPLLKQIQKQLKNNTYHTYGMTETITHVAMKKLTGDKINSYFNALTGVRFSQDKRNCLIIQAPHLSEKNIITNDIIKLLNERQFNFIGRYDNIINSGGLKISPEAVENKLTPFIKQRFTITGLADDRLGEIVVMAVEGEPDKSIEFDDIFHQAELDPYEIPKRIIFVGNFPVTTGGKVIRHKIKDEIK